jgi:3-isopropylmalate/(R)-2-methylmalate dehydratase large subunit
MGKTISEKIIGEHVGRDVEAGEIVLTNVDVCLAQDGTGPLAIRQIEKLGFDRLAKPERTVFFLDHSAPASRKELANDHALIREFAGKTGARFVDVGMGICHVIINEQYVNPGEILIGADSHTCTGGALCAFSTGMGSTDVGVGMALGKTWFRVPETYKVYVAGEFPIGVYAKDLILHLIGLIGADGATYKALEFCGPAIEKMSMNSRFTLANMAVESGAKVGLIASDEITRTYLERMGRGSRWRPIAADPDAVYERVIEIDVARLEPTVSFPHTVDNTRSVGEASGIVIDQVFLGTCTNSRLDDWETVARIVKGKEKAPGVRFIAVPGSPLVQKQVMDAGYYRILADFGAIFLPPGCGPCVGVHGGIPADGERSLTTMNRNFQGRMGNPNAEIYLASPATLAATAVEGVIADPRKYGKELTLKTFPSIASSEVLKKAATSAVDSLEKAATEASRKLSPKLKETSDVVEKTAREVIKKYEPQAKKAVNDLERTVSVLARDATKAIKDLLYGKKPANKRPAARKPLIKKKAARKKTVKRKVVSRRTAKAKTAKKAVRKRTSGTLKKTGRK